MRWKFRCLVLVLYLFIVPFCDLQSLAEEKDGLKLYSQSAVLMDGYSGRVLYGKNEKQVRPMASTTKIMTCILALEMGDLDDLVTASSCDSFPKPKGTYGSEKGREISVKRICFTV